MTTQIGHGLMRLLCFYFFLKLYTVIKFSDVRTQYKFNKPF